MTTKEMIRVFKKPTADNELRRLYTILEELDPLSEEYYKITQRIDQLEKARSYRNDLKLSASSVLGNLTSILGIGVTLYSEDVMNRLVRSKAWNWIPKARTR